MNEMIKCKSCIYHLVNKGKCNCSLYLLNPYNKDMLHRNLSVVSGSFMHPSDEKAIKHFHQWICQYKYNYLNCPSYKKCVM